MYSSHMFFESQLAGKKTYVSNAGTQLTSCGQKRHATHVGPQLTFLFFRLLQYCVNMAK